VACSKHTGRSGFVKLVLSTLEKPHIFSFWYPWIRLLIPEHRANFKSLYLSFPYPWHACWFHSKELVSKNLYLPFWNPWTRLLIPEHRAGFQESRPFILVPMDTPVDSTAPSWFPRVCTLHSRTHGHACRFYSTELVSKDLYILLSYPLLRLLIQ
jgi:hypothetical protein